MRNLKKIKKRILKEKKKLLIYDSSKLLADFLNGVVIELEEEYLYDSSRIN